MAQRASLEEKLAEIARAEREGATPAALLLLQARLGDANNIVIARAAESLGRVGGEAALPALARAFSSLVRQPATADKQCHAKEAIVAALEQLDSPDPDPYLLGIRHVQMEPVFGGRADTADNLRAQCATALARLRYREAHIAILTLLVDAEPQPRRAAARALAHLGDERSELLLRLKALSGDAEAGILGECFTGLLAIEPERSLPFVAEFLHRDDAALVEQAALALGGSHLDEAFALLRECWEANGDLALRRPLILAIALLRSDEAFQYLLQLMQDEGRTVAIMACEALAIFSSDARRREQVSAAVERLRDAKVTDAFREFFG